MQMKKIFLLILIIFTITLKAQLFYVAGLYQHIAGYVAKYGLGIDFSGSTSKYEVNAGFLRFEQDRITDNNFFLKGDYHLWHYHHAYGFRVKRWTPYIGFTLNHRNNSEIFNDTSIQSSELNMRLRTGIKVSFCSFIFATDYQFGNGGFLNGKLSYVLFVGNKCSKKYIRECNPVDWSQF